MALGNTREAEEMRIVLLVDEWCSPSFQQELKPDSVTMGHYPSSHRAWFKHTKPSVSNGIEMPTVEVTEKKHGPCERRTCTIFSRQGPCTVFYQTCSIVVRIRIRGRSRVIVLVLRPLSIIAQVTGRTNSISLYRQWPSFYFLLNKKNIYIL